MTRLSKWLYFGPLLLGPIGLLITAFVVLPTDWNTRLGGDYWLIGLGYGATLHNANCQIVITGDSTGMVAVNPKELTELTGLTACNIADNEGMQIVNGTMVLDQYLAHNAPPKYLVVMQAPDSFDPETLKGHGIGEGITYRMRQPGVLAKADFIAHNIPDVFRWVSAGLDSVLRNFHGRHFTQQEMTVRDRTRGQLLLHDPLATSCPVSGPKSKPNRAWIQSLRDRYSRKETRVLIDGMPVPNCDPDLEEFRTNLQGIVDNGVQVLPLEDYYIGGRHVNETGSKAVTAMIASQIQSLQPSQMDGAR